MTEPTTGTLTIQDRTLKTVLPPLCVSALVSALLTAAAVPLLFPFLRTVGLIWLDGPAQGAGAAGLAYVLFRVLFPRAVGLFPGGGTRRVAWEVTADALILDGQATARDTIINVHIWPNRDALGHTLPGWTVNIERRGRNLLLRFPGQDGDSGTELRNLICALGFGDRWPGA